MSIVFAAEEKKFKNIEKMGETLGEIYSKLWQEVVWLHFKWNEYVEIYGTNPERVELINKIAPQFFYIVEKALWETILLNVTRLTDPPQTFNKKDKMNLSIRQFEILVEDAQLKNELLDKIKLAVKKAKFCRDWRNRHIAHSDLDLSLNRSPKPLEAASRKLVSDAIKAIDNVLNTILYYYENSTTAFDIVNSFNGASSLLYYLNYGLKKHDEKENRIRKGNYSDEDFAIDDI